MPSEAPNVAAKTAPQYPAVPDPSRDPASLQDAVSRLKEGYELLTGQRGPNTYSMVEGLTEIRKQFVTADRVVTARMLELNEIVTEANAALAQRTTIIEAEITSARAGEANLLARITSVDTARVTGDLALAASITTVEAQANDAVDKANDATAFGQVRLQARAVPFGGASASFEVVLNANDIEAGLAFNVVGGTSEFAITANKFKIFDPAIPGGTPVPVFSYTGGKFELQGDVSVQGNLIVNGTVGNAKITDNAVSDTAAESGMVSAGAILDFNLTTRDGARVAIEAALTDTSASIYLAGLGSAFIQRVFPIKVDSVNVGDIISMDTVVAVTLSGSVYQFYKSITPATQVVMVTGLSAGSHTFSVDNPTLFALGLSLKVTELDK